MGRPFLFVTGAMNMLAEARDSEAIPARKRPRTWDDDDLDPLTRCSEPDSPTQAESPVKVRRRVRVAVPPEYCGGVRIPPYVPPRLAPPKPYVVHLYEQQTKQHLAVQAQIARTPVPPLLPMHSRSLAHFRLTPPPAWMEMETAGASESSANVDKTYVCVRAPHPKMVTLSEQYGVILLQWMLQVGFEYSLRTTAIFSALRTMQTLLLQYAIPRKVLQLIGTATLSTGAKQEEIYQPTQTDFVYMTDHTYSPRELRAAEQCVLEALYRTDCPLQPVTAVTLLDAWHTAGTYGRSWQDRVYRRSLHYLAYYSCLHWPTAAVEPVLSLACAAAAAACHSLGLATPAVPELAAHEVEAYCAHWPTTVSYAAVVAAHTDGVTVEKMRGTWGEPDASSPPRSIDDENEK